MNEVEKRVRDSRKYELYLGNIMFGFSIVDSWNMAIQTVKPERLSENRKIDEDQTTICSKTVDEVAR